MQFTDSDIQALAQVSNHRVFIEILEQLAGEHLALCGTLPVDQVAKQQGQYQAYDSLLKHIRGAAIQMEQRRRTNGLPPGYSALSL